MVDLRELDTILINQAKTVFENVFEIKGGWEEIEFLEYVTDKIQLHPDVVEFALYELRCNRKVIKI